MADRPVDQHDIDRLLQEDLLDRLLGRYPADAPTADPRECGSCPHHRAAHATGSSEMGAMGEMRLITPDDIAELIRRDVHETRRGPAPTADPRECRSCIHPRLSHSTWGCEWCSCGVSIVDLTAVGRLS